MSTRQEPAAADPSHRAEVSGAEPVRVGRKRDHTRDAVILQATLDVLAEVGYANMTMAMVAGRARAGKGAVYRRWSSKEDLVLDAVGRSRPGRLELDELPDTGTLRGDLLALFRPQTREESEKRMRVMAGLASMALTNSGFDEALQATMITPWAEEHLLLMERARKRGQISPVADLATIAQVVPSVAAYRALIQRQPFEADFLTTWIDGVVLPALNYHMPAR